MIKPKIQLEITNYLLKLRAEECWSPESDIEFNVGGFLSAHPNVRELDLANTLKAMMRRNVDNVDYFDKKIRGRETVITKFDRNRGKITIIGSTTSKLNQYKNNLLSAIGKGDLKIDEKEKKIYSTDKEMAFSDTRTWYFVQCLYENYDRTVALIDIWDYVDNKDRFPRTSSPFSETMKKKMVYNAINPIQKRMKAEQIDFFRINTEYGKGYKMTR